MHNLPPPTCQSVTPVAVQCSERANGQYNRSLCAHTVCVHTPQRFFVSKTHHTTEPRPPACWPLPEDAFREGGIPRLYMAACAGDHNAVDQELADGTDPDQPLGTVTPLIGAALEGRTAMVDKLLAAGACVNSQCSRGATALLGAARFGYHDTVQRLLRAEGIDLNAGPDDEGTALRIAIRCGHQKTANALWEAGADVYRVSQRPKKDCPPLRTAAIYGDSDVIEYIASHAACIDTRFDDGYTALALACAFGQTECVRVLLDVGADINQSGLLGATPLHVAVKWHCADVVRLLLERGALLKAAYQGMNPLHTASINNAEQCVEVLLDMTGGHAVDTPCPYSGMTALHWAAHMGHAGIIRQLLKWGADVHKQPNNGPTALYAAVQDGHVEAARTLILAGAGQGEKGRSDKAFDDAVLQRTSVAMLEALGLNRVPDGSI